MVGVGETGPIQVPISNVFHSQTWCSEPYLSTDRRNMNRPSRKQAYPLHHLTLPTSISILDKLLSILLWYSYQGQDNGIVPYEDGHHHVGPCPWYPAVVHDITKGHILQMAGCTLINPTDSIASLTYSDAQFWKQRSKVLTRLPSHTHSRPRPLCNAWKAVVTSLKCGK